jgi:hypothetical protein
MPAMGKVRKPTPRQRLKQSTKTVPPRNGLVALSHARRAGAHGKTEKALRRAAKMDLRQPDED